MKTKTGISLMMALLMVVSTFVVGAVNVDSCNDETYGALNGGLCWPFGEVCKEVYDGEGWVEEYTAELNETVHFRITLTYYNTDHPTAQYAKNITVVDTLPDCLEYDSADPEPTSVVGQIITWDFGDLILYEGDSIVILLNATVVAYTDQDGEDNLVEVNATEKCSDRDLYGSDIATVICEEPPCEEGIEVEKKVLVDDEWVDFIGDLILGDIVTFQITITYKDCDPLESIVCLEVYDYLPCCLDFAGGVSYEGSTFEVPVIDPTVEGKTITWSWTGVQTIVMNDGDVLVITFDAEVTSYCQEQDINLVEVFAWTCCDDFFGSDYVDVDCTPPDTTFEKTVKDGEEWVDIIETYYGEVLTFKLELIYYGLEPLENIRFVDQLPCILEFVSYEANVNLTLEISDDGKTLWFNVSEEVTLEHGDCIVITFLAEVTGCTECGCGCDIEAFNYANVTGGCGQEPTLFMEDEVQIISYANCPPSTPQIRGATTGETGDELSFYVVSTDPDDDQIYYYLDMDDGNIIATLTPVDSGEEVELTYTFGTAGTYYLKAMAEDIHGAESDWTAEGYEHVVVIEEDEVEESIEITVKRFGIGRICAEIENEEETAFTNVSYTISMTGGLLGRVNVSHNCTIEELAAGATEQICTSSTMFGAGSVKLFCFGRVNGEVEIIAGGETYPYEFSGFVIGKLVLITKQGIPEE